MWLPNGLGRALFLFRNRVFTPFLRCKNGRYWNSAQRRPLSSVQSVSGTRFPELRDNPAMLEAITAMAAMGVKCAAMPAGVQNDWAVMIGANGIVPDTITSPTLIVHDRQDPVVPFVHAEWSHKCIPQSHLLDIHAGGHLIWFGKDALHMHNERVAFIKASLTAWVAI